MKNIRYPGAKFCACILSFLSLLTSFFTVCAAWYLKIALQKMSILSFVCLAVLFVMSIVTDRIRNFVAFSLSEKNNILLRESIIKKLNEKKMADCVVLNNGASYTRIISDVSTLGSKYVSVIPSAVGSVVTLFLAGILLFIINVKFAVVLTVCALVGLAYGFIMRRILKKKALKVSEGEENLSDLLYLCLENSETVRTAVREDVINDKIHESHRTFSSARRNYVVAKETGSAFMNVFVQIMFVAVIAWAALTVKDNKDALPQMASLLSLMFVFKSPVSCLASLQGSLASCDASFKRLCELDDFADELAVEIPQDAKLLSVEFKNVTFRYSSDRENVLENFNAVFKANEWTMMSALSGKGKTTVFRLILGLFEPQSGNVIVNTSAGVFPACRSTRRFFAYVPQNPVLFASTVKDNLLLANPNADDIVIKNALDCACCSFVNDLYDGVRLSWGQKQRLTIARALMNEGRLLLLDECTSGVDRKTAENVMSNLKACVKGAVVSSHSYSDSSFSTVQLESAIK